jgi:two-component system sensor histidine kinase KdpD
MVSITWFCSWLKVNATTVAFAYLLAVLAIAARRGLAESVIASVAAALCFNYYFLPPIGTFTIADPLNWVALFAFLVTAIVASHLSDSARKRTREAIDRQQEMERLYELSRSLLLNPAEQPMAAQIAQQVARIFGCEGISFYDRKADRVFRAGPKDIPEGKLKVAATQNTEFQDSEARTILLPVSLGGHSIGSMSVMGGQVSEAALHAIANLSAIALEKASAQAAATRAEAARQHEELKSTLLDAVAHEFKTPLTSIKAATTTLLSTDSRNTTERELLTVIDEETDRLSEMVTEAIHMARIDAGKLRLDKHPLSVRSVIEEVLAQLKPLLEDRRVDISSSDVSALVNADPEMIRLVLRQLLSNALKYSPPGSPLTIHVSVENDSVEVGVADRGCGMSDEEQARIFDRFYRAPTVRDRVPGTGMGLTIARAVIEAHGGRMWVHSRMGHGSEFFFSLPVSQVAVNV